MQRHTMFRCNHAYPPVLSPAGVGGSHTHSRTRANGGVISTLGPEFDDYARNRAILGFLGEPPNEAILDLRDPQNRTRDQDSVPKGPKISSYGPFLSHLVRISSKIKLNPSRPTWGNLAMYFCFFFQLGNLDFEGSKKAPETS